MGFRVLGFLGCRVKGIGVQGFEFRIYRLLLYGYGGYRIGRRKHMQKPVEHEMETEFVLGFMGPGGLFQEE